MHIFFYGWRRKAGVVALVMALALVCLWIRSGVAYCSTSLRLHGSQYTLFSHNGGVTFWHQKETDFGYKETEWLTPSIVAQRPGCSYPVIVLPLTLLSAYLILWKPRKRACPN